MKYLTSEELLRMTGKKATELSGAELSLLTAGASTAQKVLRSGSAEPFARPVKMERSPDPATLAPERTEKQKHKDSFFQAIENGDVRTFKDMATKLGWNLFSDQIDALLTATLRNNDRWTALEVVKTWPNEERIQRLRQVSDVQRWDLPKMPGEQVQPSETVLERTERPAAKSAVPGTSPQPPSSPPPSAIRETQKTATPPVVRIMVRQSKKPDPGNCESTEDGLRREKRKRKHGPEGSQFFSQPQGKPQGHRTPRKPRWSPEVSLAKAAGMGVEESLEELRRSGKVLAGLAAGRDRTG